MVKITLFSPCGVVRTVAVRLETLRNSSASVVSQGRGLVGSMGAICRVYLSDKRRACQDYFGIFRLIDFDQTL